MLTINPFVAGIFCTLFVEMAIVIITAIIHSKDKGDK